MLDSLLAEPGWDRPFFKKLAHNDTGAAAGHQGGMVLPKDLTDFFPGLRSQIAPDAPVADKHIRAALIVDGETRAMVFTRYQYQTRGGQRSPEYRLTDNLAELRNRAIGGDYLVFQRNMDDVEFYRLILIRTGTEDHDRLAETVAGRRWGLITSDTPLREQDLEESRVLQRERQLLPFELFDLGAHSVTSTTSQLARSIVFRESLLSIYSGACAACGEGLRRGESFEIEGAHIVPRHRHGCDDARNGLSLCRTHHWAFDRGLFGVDSNRKILVPEVALLYDENAPLESLQGHPISPPTIRSLLPDDSALEWHRNNVLLT